MIPIFNDYVRGRVIFLAGLEAVVLLIGACVGISLRLADPAMWGGLAAAPTRALFFSFGMLIVLSSMGLYQPDLGQNGRSMGPRLIGAFLLGFLVTGLVSYAVPALYIEPFQIAGVVVLALAGSAL